MGLKEIETRIKLNEIKQAREDAMLEPFRKQLRESFTKMSIEELINSLAEMTKERNGILRVEYCKEEIFQRINKEVNND